MNVDGPFPVKLTSSGVLFCILFGNGPKRFRLSLEASDDVSVFLNHRYKYCTMIEAVFLQNITLLHMKIQTLQSRCRRRRRSS